MEAGWFKSIQVQRQMFQVAGSSLSQLQRARYWELLPELKSRGKTVIVISGDDAYFDCADRIVMLFEGTLAIADAPSVRSRFQAEPESSERDSYA